MEFWYEMWIKKIKKNKKKKKIQFFTSFHSDSCVYNSPFAFLLMFPDIEIVCRKPERDSAKLTRAFKKLKNEFFMFSFMLHIPQWTSCNNESKKEMKNAQRMHIRLGCSGDVMIFNKNSSLLPRKKNQQHKIKKKTLKNSRTTKRKKGKKEKRKAKRIEEILEDWKRFLRQ